MNMFQVPFVIYEVMQSFLAVSTNTTQSEYNDVALLNERAERRRQLSSGSCRRQLPLNSLCTDSKDSHPCGAGMSNTSHDNPSFCKHGSPSWVPH